MLPVETVLLKGIKNEKWLRGRAIRAGRESYPSPRPCQHHGYVERDLKGACLPCLDDGRSRNQAKR